MPELAFTKGHGTGNDFVLVADADGRLDLAPDQVAALCDRHSGVGADGLLRAVRVAAEPAARVIAESAGDRDAEWFMDYRNADGSLSEMCGNGIRVFTAFLLAEGLTALPEGGELAILTRGGTMRVRRVDDGFEVDLGRWRLEPHEVTVQVAGVDVPRPGTGITVPNPHVVIALADRDELAAADLASPPVLDPPPVDGANVELVHPEDPLVQSGTGRIRMRVHERGSGETLSCGTGAVAAALATRHWAGPSAPHRWRVEVPGGVLGVRMFAGADGEHVALSGPAVLVYSGRIEGPAALATSSTR